MPFEIETLDYGIAVFLTVAIAILIYELRSKRKYGENHKGTKP